MPDGFAKSSSATKKIAPVMFVSAFETRSSASRPARSAPKPSVSPSKAPPRPNPAGPSGDGGAAPKKAPTLRVLKPPPMPLPKPAMLDSTHKKLTYGHLKHPAQEAPPDDPVTMDRESPSSGAEAVPVFSVRQAHPVRVGRAAHQTGQGLWRTSARRAVRRDASRQSRSRQRGSVLRRNSRSLEQVGCLRCKLGTTRR